MSNEAHINNPTTAKDYESNNDNDNNISGGSGGNNGGSGGGDGEPSRRACAACKYNRKKCIREECAMWNHFPAQKAEQFAAVQQVFGLKNLTKNIKDLNKQQQEEAIRAFEWEAMCWKDDPVHGPLGQYEKLEQQSQQLLAYCYMLEEDNILLRQQLSIIQQQAPMLSPQKIGSRMLPPGPHGVGPHDVRFGPFFNPLGFQGSVRQQAYRFDHRPCHTGRRGGAMGRSHLRWNDGHQDANGMDHTFHTVPYHQHNLRPSPLGYIQQNTGPDNQYNPANPNSTADPTKKKNNQ